MEGRRPTLPEGRCIPRLQARRISTPRSPAGYYALRDATHWDQDVFNPFDGKFRVRVIMPQCGSVLAPGRRVFPNVLPVNGSRRRHAPGPRKRNATPLRSCGTPPSTSHLSPRNHCGIACAGTPPVSTTRRSRARIPRQYLRGNRPMPMMTSWLATKASNGPNA